MNGETVWRWRKAFGVGRAGTEGSRRLIQASADKGGANLRGKPLPAEQAGRRRRTIKALNLKRFLKPGYHGRWWTRRELALLGTLPDEEVAARIGRTVGAVRVMRTRLGIRTALDGRKKGGPNDA